MSTYWNSVLQQRLSRRRALAVGGGATIGAALLAACGSGSSSGGGSPAGTDKSGLLTPILDDTKSATKGGVLKLSANFELVHLDPQVTGNHTTEGPAFYSQLFMIKYGYMQPTNGEIQGDLIDGWEISGDKLTITGKLNPGAHFAPVAPVNGRVVDANDVVFSWNRFLSVGTRAIELANSKSPDAPIVSITNPDDKTVVIKLKEPNATVLTSLAQTAVGTFFILPKEAGDEKVLDVRTQPAGSGPWMLKSWTPGVGTVHKKNPGFGQDKTYAGMPLVDEIERPAIVDYAVAISQFRAGAIYSYAVKNEDILNTKRENNALLMRSAPMASGSVRYFFGQLPTAPFKDERVRLAWMMSIDRDLYNDTAFNVTKNAADGLPVDVAWEGALSAAAWNGWFVDPKNKDFGPNTKFFQHDIATAKQLLTAAGFANGVDTTVHYPPTGLPTTYYPQLEILNGMVRDAGLFRFNLDLVNYNTEWTPRFRNIRGQFNDVAAIYDTANPDPTNNLFSHYHSSGALYQGGDSTLDDLATRAVKEFDTGKRQDLIKQLQQYEGGKMFYPKVGAGSGFTLVWPAYRNQNVWQTGTLRDNVAIWVDPNQAPLKHP